MRRKTDLLIVWAWFSLLAPVVSSKRFLLEGEMLEEAGVNDQEPVRPRFTPDRTAEMLISGSDVVRLSCPRKGGAGAESTEGHRSTSSVAHRLCKSRGFERASTAASCAELECRALAGELSIELSPWLEC